MFFLLLTVLFHIEKETKILCSSLEINSLIHIVSSVLDFTEFLFNLTFLLIYKIWTGKDRRLLPFLLVVSQNVEKYYKLEKFCKVSAT